MYKYEKWWNQHSEVKDITKDFWVQYQHLNKPLLHHQILVNLMTMLKKMRNYKDWLF